ncbi:MAG: apolipoprotein N-acyltransferase [Candidatus Cloacimonetes bacterium]|nr:apolipoprotein N-acyltransferase [Candidatus Cloacimonadota bacterium]
MISLIWVLLSAVLISVSRLPLHLGFLVFIAWIPLWHYLRIAKARIWMGAAIFSLIQMAIIFYWISEVTPGGLVGIGIIFFFFYWLSFYLIRLIARQFPKLGELGFISVMLSFEFLQNFGETRFPWFNTAYSLSDYTWLIQIADLGGVILISGLILGINMLLYRVIKGQTRCLVWIAAIIAIWSAYGIYSLKLLPMQKHDPHIAIMQPSIPQDEKWDMAAYRRILDKYDLLCRAAAQDSIRLIIFPEAAMPVYLMYDPKSMRELNRLATSYHLEIFTGFPHYEKAPPEHVNDDYFYNSAALFKPDGTFSKLYYKNILVPIGERMLWLDYFPMLWKLQFGQANWEFGRELQYYRSGAYQFSPSICYELAFANIHQRMAIPRQDGKLRKLDYLVNITNDAWFGTSYGPWLHAVMTKFRAVENRIQIFRSANTGISMAVDPCGRIISKAGLFEVSNLKPPLYTCSRIPLYRHIPHYPFIFVGLALILAILSWWRALKGGRA